MNKLDKDGLNEFFADICAQLVLGERCPVSGQREVFQAQHTKENKKYIVKIAHYASYSIDRLQRELSILNRINSAYFPSVIWHTTVTKALLDDYFDQLDFQTKDVEFKSIRQDVDAHLQKPFNPFLVTVEEFVENISWQDFSKNMTEDKLCEVLTHCFLALKLLWNEKIVHRDLKPGNILITPNLRPVIIDLGIAKSLNDGTRDLTLAFFKNPHTIRFASPEQLMDDKDAISYKTDQYSLGIVAYHSLSGMYPFGDIEQIGPDELLRNMMDFKYVPLTSLGIHCSDDLESVIKKLLMPHPYQRFRNADSIIKALQQVQRTTS